MPYKAPGGSPTRVLVTGANGYVGRRLVGTARRAGLEVVPALRDPRGTMGAVRFDLRRPEGLDEILERVDAVVHLAAILRGGEPRGEDDPNVVGTRELLAAARRRGVRRFVFVSSQSAAADAPSAYGESKWRIERMLEGEGEVAVRLGLISGGPPRGVYGQLFRMVGRWPAIPVLRPGAPVHPLHVDDLCAALVSLVETGETLPRLFWIGPRTPMRFADYLRLLARERLGRRVRLLPVPVAPVLVLLRLASFVPFLPALPDERIRGLAALGPMAPELHCSIGEARRIEDAFAAEGRRRRLIAEGAALTAYVLGRRPAPSTVRRYARAVLASGDPAPLDLPGLFRAWPSLLRAFETPGGSGRLRRRLDTATRIVEMTPQAAPRFHLYERRPRAIAMADLAWTVAAEALLLPLRAILGRWSSFGR